MWLVHDLSNGVVVTRWLLFRLFPFFLDQKDGSWQHKAKLVTRRIAKAYLEPFCGLLYHLQLTDGRYRFFFANVGNLVVLDQTRSILVQTYIVLFFIIRKADQLTG